MSSTFGGTIKLNGENEYRQAVKNITAELKTYKAEIQKVSAEFYKEDEQEKKLTSTNKVLNEAIEKQKQKIELLRSAYEKNKEELGENDSKTQGWKNQLVKAEAELYKMESSVYKNEKVLDDLKDAQDDNVESLEDFGSAEDEAGKKAITFGDLIKSHLISEAIISGLGKLKDMMVDLAKDTINTGMEFNTAMNQVGATMGMTTDDINGGSEAFQDLKDAAIEAGATTKYSCTEASEALNYLALAGYDANDSIKLLPVTLNLAQAGNMDLAQATDMVTDSMSAFGLTINDTATFTDQMAKTASKTNTSVSQLGEAYLTVGATAKTLKGGTGELNTALGILANNGIKGSEGGTHLRNVIMSLQNPTDKASASLEKLGVKVFDSQGNMRGMNDILTDMNKSMSTMSQEEKQNIISSIFNKTDIASVSALLDNCGDSWSDLTVQIEDSEGACQNMADVMNDNLQGDITSLQSALDAFKVTLFDSLDAPIRTVTQNARNSISNLQGALKDSGISGFIQQLGIECQTWFNSVIDLIKNIGDKLPEMVPLGIQAVINFAQGAIDNLPAIVEAGISILEGLVKGVVNSIPMLIEQVPVLINNFWQKFDECVLMLVSSGASIIAQLIQGIIENIPNLIANAGEIVSAIVNTIAHLDMLEIGKNLMTSLISGISSLFGSIKSTASNIASNAIKNIFGNLSLKNIGSTIMNGLKSGISSIGGGIKSAVSSIASSIKSVFSGLSLKDIGSNLVKGLWNGISSVKDWILSKIKGFGSSILGGIKSFFGIHSPSTVFRDEVGVNLAQGLGLGFTDEMENVSKDIQNSIPTSYDLDLQSNISNGGLSEDIRQSLAVPGLDLSGLENKFDLFMNMFEGRFKELTTAIQSMKIILDDGTLVGSLAGGMDKELGNIYRMKARGI